MTKTLTHSEELFERYLTSRYVSWSRVPRARHRTPDYLVSRDGSRFWFEVKEFDEPGNTPTGSFSPCPFVVRKINKAGKQLESLGNDVCAIVLHNCRTIFRSTEVAAVLSAAFGEVIHMDRVPIPLLTDEPCGFKFSGKSAMDGFHNTTIGAIIILEHYELSERMVDAFAEVRRKHSSGEKLPFNPLGEVLQDFERLSTTIAYSGAVRLRVLENPYACRPFPSDLFCGPFDQRWGPSKTGWYTLLQLGSELTRLRNRLSRPVPLQLL